MSCKMQSEELQKQLENEYLKFLCQKIRHAGGSVQLQHLAGLLQQLRFEIRSAFGITKPELLKFLRDQPSIFEINSRGIVSIEPLNNYDDSLGNCLNETAHNNNEIFLPKIENGKGNIRNIFAEFAIIEAVSPVKTYVFFTPTDYGAEKDSVFENTDLAYNKCVYFNAVHGHLDYEIEYCATRVWQSAAPEDDVSDFRCANVRNFNKNKFRQKYSDEKHMSDTDHKSAAKSVKMDSKTPCQQNKISSNIRNNHMESSGYTERNVGPSRESSTAKNILENQYGKLYPYSEGAVIKFGKNFSEVVDGKTCNYFMFGSKISSDILTWEFVEGDDVRFDAVKSKGKHGWKAILVWVGEKPAYTENCQKIIKLALEENFVDQQSIAPDTSCNSSDLPLSTRSRKNIINELHSEKGKKISSLDSSNSRKFTKHQGLRMNRSKENIDEEQYIVSDASSDISDSPLRTASRKNNINEQNFIKIKKSSCLDSSDPRKSSKSQRQRKTAQDGDVDYQKYIVSDISDSHLRIRSGKNNINEPHSVKNKLFSDCSVRKKINKSQESVGLHETHSQNYSTKISKNRRTRTKHDRKKLAANSRDKNDYELSDIANDVEEKCYSTLFSDDTLSDSKEDNLEESKFQNIVPRTKKFLKEYHPEISLNNTENDPESEVLVSENVNNNLEKVKIFREIEGKIENILCKFAFIKSPHLQKDVDFFLNVFYLNGISVGDNEITDLKEVIKVGETIKFNCFEVTDDFGEVHQKVTMAWKGVKPQVYEMTPEEFIVEQDLSVSIGSKLKSECKEENRAMSENVSDIEIDSNIDDPEIYSSSENLLTDTSSNYYTKIVNEEIKKIFHENLDSSKHEEVLSQKIMERLEAFGIVSSDSEVYTIFLVIFLCSLFVRKILM